MVHHQKSSPSSFALETPHLRIEVTVKQTSVTILYPLAPLTSFFQRWWWSQWWWQWRWWRWQPQCWWESCNKFDKVFSLTEKMQRCWCAAPKTKYFAETHLNSGGKFGAGHSNKRGWDLISTNKRRLSRNERGSIGVRGESLEFSNLPPCSKARTAAGPRLLFS